MMSTELRFVCATLAVWRLAHLLTAEDGPADLVVRIRARLGDSVAGRAMDCLYCLSLWLAAPLALFVSTDPVGWTVTWLALSGGACLLERATDRGSTDSTTDRAQREGVSDELLRPASPSPRIHEHSPDGTGAGSPGAVGADPDGLPR